MGSAALLAKLMNTQTQADTTILAEPIGAGNGSIEAVPEVLEQKINFEPFMVSANSSTPLECIDGRRPVDIDAPVGAKLAG